MEGGAKTLAAEAPNIASIGEAVTPNGRLNHFRARRFAVPHVEGHVNAGRWFVLEMTESGDKMLGQSVASENNTHDNTGNPKVMHDDTGTCLRLHGPFQDSIEKFFLLFLGRCRQIRFA